MNNKWTKKVSGFAIGWIIGILLWRMIRTHSLTTNADHELLNITVSPGMMAFIPLFVAILAGLTFGTVQYLYEKFSLKSISFRAYILKSLLIHLCLMIGIYFLMYSILSFTGSIQDMTFIKLITSPLLLVNIVYTIMINSAIILIIQINQLLGRGNLRKLVMGKFYTPKEEIRAFMFLDLKGSTTIAEQLGHLKYSRFIQDCFHFLGVMDDYKVSIYQYVGDEVVLTWEADQDIILKESIDSFYAYTGVLKTKKDYFENEYGVQPVFKAGLHLGPITVVEVGNLKREIAFHGDTINVASRIQEQCKNFDSSLLISEEVYEKVKDLKNYTFKNVGEFVLRGRKNSIQLYDVLAQET